MSSPRTTRPSRSRSSLHRRGGLKATLVALRIHRLQAVEALKNLAGLGQAGFYSEGDLELLQKAFENAVNALDISDDDKKKILEKYDAFALGEAARSVSSPREEPAEK